MAEILPCKDFPTDLHLYDAIKSTNRLLVSQAVKCMYSKFMAFRLSIINKYRNVGKNLKDIEQLADDVYQESITELITQIQTGRFVIGKCAIHTYFYVIFKRMYLRLVQKESNVAVYIDNANPQAIAAHNEPNNYLTGESIRTKTERMELLKKALLELNEGCVDVLSKRYFKKGDLTEMATSAGKTVGAIKTHIYDCQQKLKKKLIDKYNFGKDGIWL